MPKSMKNGFPTPGSAWWLGIPGGCDRESPNSREWEASKTFIRIPCRWPTYAISRLQKAGTGFGCWDLGCGQVGPNRTSGVPKTKKKWSCQTLQKMLPTTTKTLCQTLKRWKNNKKSSGSFWQTLSSYKRCSRLRVRKACFVYPKGHSPD